MRDDRCNYTTSDPRLASGRDSANHPLNAPTKYSMHLNSQIFEKVQCLIVCIKIDRVTFIMSVLIASLNALKTYNVYFIYSPPEHTPQHRNLYSRIMHFAIKVLLWLMCSIGLRTHTHTHTQPPTRLYTHTSTCLNYACIHVYMYECTYVCMYVCRYVCVWVCVYVCMYRCMYVCMCVCM